MPISRDDVLHVAELARLALTGKEAEVYTAQLQRILHYIEKLSELDTTGVEPTVHATPPREIFRDDAVAGSITSEDALMNAPVKDRGCFKVPKIIE